MIDWTTIITTLIATTPLTLTSLGGLIVILRRVEKVHKATNSMKDALVASALLEGEAIGAEKERAKSAS